MPILTESLIKSAEQMKTGWTKLRLLEAKVVEKEGVKSDMCIFEGVAGPGNTDDNVGRRLTVSWNGKALDPANPVPDVVKNLLEFMAAIMKISMVEVKQIRGEISFNQFAGKELWGEVIDTTYNGKVYKNVSTWGPEDVVPF